MREINLSLKIPRNPASADAKVAACGKQSLPCGKNGVSLGKTWGKLWKSPAIR